MGRLTLIAVAVCLLISVAEPQGFTILTENRRINVRVGGNALFSVKPSAAVNSGNWDFRGKTVGQWIGTTVGFNTEYITRAEIFPANGSLLLKSVTVSDSGDYTVSMHPVNGSAATKTIALHVLAEPQGFTILTENSQINVTVGGNALFSVKPSATVRAGNWDLRGKTVGLWIESNIVIDNVYKTRAEIFAANGSLLLKSVTVSDSGDYTISMTPVNGSATTKTIALQVLAEPQGFTILTENSRINVTVGGDVFFTVKPSAAVRSGSWHFGRRCIAFWFPTEFHISYRYQERAQLFLSNGSLLLRSATVSDSGDYTVSITPDEGREAAATITLHVIAEPQGFTILTENRRITVTVGGNAFFSVKPSAAVRSGNWDFREKAVGMWIRTAVDFNTEYKTRAEIFLPNGSLLLKSVTVSDSGDYTVSMNPVNGSATATKTIALHVLAEPQDFTILTGNRHINVSVGGNALFSVQPSAAALLGNWQFGMKHIVEWVDALLDTDFYYNGRIKLLLPNGSLLLQSVTPLDSGKYSVRMVSYVGFSNTAQFTLQVLAESRDFTILIENKRINVTVGGNALFSVKPSAGVKSGSWNFAGKMIASWIATTVDRNDDYRWRASIVLPNGSLLLQSVAVSDSGDYTVSLTPDVGGETTAIITLHVLEITNKENNSSLGSIIGTVIIILAVIIGITIWGIRKKISRAKGGSQQNNIRVASPGNETFWTTHGARSAGPTYENVPSPDNAEKAVGKSPDRDSYTQLNLEDQSIYYSLRK
ncbi:cell adhesion molecule CEACAM3-like [Cetorhinus maximus]